MLINNFGAFSEESETVVCSLKHLWGSHFKINYLGNIPIFKRISFFTKIPMSISITFKTDVQNVNKECRPTICNNGNNNKTTTNNVLISSIFFCFCCQLLNLYHRISIIIIMFIQ